MQRKGGKTKAEKGKYANEEPPLPLSPLLLPSSYLAHLDSPSQLLCPLPLCVLEGGALRG